MEDIMKKRWGGKLVNVNHPGTPFLLGHHNWKGGQPRLKRQLLFIKRLKFTGNLFRKNL